MSCAIKFMKFILFSLNLLFVLFGLAFLVAGSWALLNIPSFTQAISFAFDNESGNNEIYHNAQLLRALAYVFIGLGLFIFSVAFFGCCGVVTDSYCLLISYAVVVSIFFLAKIISVLVFLLLGEKISPLVVDRFQNNLSLYYKGYLGLSRDLNETPYSEAMDAIMVKFECCGINGPEDFGNFNKSILWHQEGRSYVDGFGQEVTGDAIGLPLACSTIESLHRHMKNIQCPIKPAVNFNELGCVEKISSDLKQYTVVIAVTPVIIAVIEVVGVILASALAHEIKQDAERLYY